MRADDRWPDDLGGSDWSEFGPPPALHPDHPSAPMPRVQLRGGRHRAPGMPTVAAPGRSQVQLARPTDAHTPVYYGAPPPPFYQPAPPACYEAPVQSYYGSSFGDGRRTAGLDARAAQMLRFIGEESPELPGPYRPQAGEPTGDSLWLSGRILADADDQAAGIRQQASYRAAEITQQASAQAAMMRQAAEGEAAELRRQASEHANAIRAAAQREAAELRSAVMAMSAELGQVAAYVTESLGRHAWRCDSPRDRLTALPAQELAAREAAIRSARPTARPARSTTATRPTPTRPGPTGPGPTRPGPARPDAVTATRPGAPPAQKPRARPARRPGIRPHAKPGGRQATAMRKMAVAFVALFTACVISGAAEIGLHGFDFFVFRSAGTGATDNNGLQENQGPGQPDAPRAHHNAKPAAPVEPKSHRHLHRQKP